MSPMQSPVSQEMPSQPRNRRSARDGGAGSFLGDEHVQWIDAERVPSTTQVRSGFGGREFLRVLERQRVVAENRQNARLAMAWLAENKASFRGRWIALSGNTLIAVGDSAAEVYAQLGRAGDPPFVLKIEPEELAPFAGW